MFGLILILMFGLIQLIKSPITLKKASNLAHACTFD